MPKSFRFGDKLIGFSVYCLANAAAFIFHQSAEGTVKERETRTTRNQSSGRTQFGQQMNGTIKKQ